MLTRLQKIMADRGYCSRRKAEELIQDGRVEVDGVKVTELGSKFEEDTAVIKIGDDVLNPLQGKKYHYILVNKPLGFICSLSDDRGRKTVDLLVPSEYGRLFPVGRLDINSSGLLIMTDDGDFANLVMHPSSGLEKTYRAEVSGKLTPDDVRRMEAGIMLEDGKTAPAEVEVVSVSDRYSVFEITIHEGKNREVRRINEALGHETLTLERTKIGPLILGDMPHGAYIDIPESTVQKIKEQCLYNKAHNTYKKEE